MAGERKKVASIFIDEEGFLEIERALPLRLNKERFLKTDLELEDIDDLDFLYTEEGLEVEVRGRNLE